MESITKKNTGEEDKDEEKRMGGRKSTSRKKATSEIHQGTKTANETTTGKVNPPATPESCLHGYNTRYWTSYAQPTFPFRTYCFHRRRWLAGSITWPM